MHRHLSRMKLPHSVEYAQSHWGVAPIVVTTAVATILAIALKRLFFSPLSSIPGPWLAKTSDLYMQVLVLGLRRCRVVHELFAKYGPVVRVGPTTVLFHDAAASKIVYTRFPKNAVYATFKIAGVDDVFTFLDNKDHITRRRALLPHFLPASLELRQLDILTSISKLVDFLRHDEGKVSRDALVVLKHFMVDVITCYVVDKPAGALDGLSLDQPHFLSDAASDFGKSNTMQAAFPGPVWAVLRQIPHKRWRRFCRAAEIVRDFAAQAFEELQQAKTPDIEVNQDGEFNNRCLMARMIHYARQHPEVQAMTAEDIICECAGFLIAGAETTSTSASFALWELSRRPEILARIREELQLNDVQTSTLNVHELPFLTAFVREVLRVHSSVPAPLTRDVPPTSQDFHIGAFRILAGTTVGTQAWTVHRDSTVFPNPDLFEPERWLKNNANRDAHWMPFGSGSRECIGKHLAMMSIKMIIAAIALNFDISPAPETTEASMEIREAFLAFPAGLHVNLIFTPVPRTEPLQLI